jgi:excisionase family DNA binding protein
MARLNVKQAAEYVGVSKSFLDRLRSLGGGPRFIKLGKKVLYDHRDIDKWIEDHKQNSTADIPSLRPNTRRIRRASFLKTHSP